MTRLHPLIIVGGGLLLGAALAAPPALADDMTEPMAFTVLVDANGHPTDSMMAVGVIDAKAPYRFLDVLLTKPDYISALPPGSWVWLRSKGGDPDAAMKLGRLFRIYGLNTEVLVPFDMDALSRRLPEQGVCVSACGWAFLGGVQRRVKDEGVLGYHQFAWSDGRYTRYDMALAQLTSALIVAYLHDMDIDSRLFTLSAGANPNELFYPNAHDRWVLRIVTE